ncbi:putative hemerythrin-like metal-binding protein [Megalodesulfovibrio gigas DSM 1382 = ATCC 19364]|uniref:Putative hemerythrin-like metal-binding protein n=2 Tax=Megalodesulfovibrio gigas TaxID=879 RepID=T2G6W1_MEGG1|nr:putative hemerythrin-like metal-binding protein [Megalodesulfovibrio gigas DSM 1382 = ATCC 19364]
MYGAATPGGAFCLPPCPRFPHGEHMHPIDWNESLHIGVATIDEQHGRLTDTINALLLAYMQGQEREVLAGIINELHDYAHTHFATEESLMRRFDGQYSELTIHLQQHTMFFTRIVDFLLEYVGDPQGELTPEVLDFLTDWWKTHVTGIDARFGKFLNQQGIQ